MMVKRLSERVEFWIILLVAYGYPMVVGVAGFRAEPSGGPARVTDADLGSLVAYELVVGLLILGFLRGRGVAWADLRPPATWLDTLRGLGLFFGAVVAMWAGFVFAATLPSAAERLANVPVEVSFGLPAAVLVALINPLFEECINLGYIQSRLRPQGAAYAVGVALLVRLLANLDQGPHALVGIVPLGLLFGIYHWRTGRLWPVIVAHAVIEAVGLYAVSHAPVAP